MSRGGESGTQAATEIFPRRRLVQDPWAYGVTQFQISTAPLSGCVSFFSGIGCRVRVGLVCMPRHSLCAKPLVIASPSD